MNPLLYLRLGGMAVFAFAAWYVYGWGNTIISNYGAMAAKIERLERDKANIESRTTSLRTLMARRDAAIAASKCKDTIQYWVKNPDEIPKPFTTEEVFGTNK